MGGAQIAHFAELDGAHGARLHAHRLMARLAQRPAGVALLDDLVLLDELRRTIGTRVHAGLATDAGLVVVLHRAVIVLVHGARGAIRHAGRALAVVAGEVQVEHGHLRVRPAFEGVHPAQAGARHLDVATILAGHLAGLAADAAGQVNIKSQAHDLSLLSVVGTGHHIGGRTLSIYTRGQKRPALEVFHQRLTVVLLDLDEQAVVAVHLGK